MPKFTPQVLDFIRDFVIEDIQKVLKCSSDDAKEALHRIITQPVNQNAGRTEKTHQDRARQFHKAKLLVAEPKSLVEKESTRVKGQYSNANPWDKYQ